MRKNKIDITWLAQNSIYDFPAMYGFVKTKIAETTVIYLEYRKLEKPEKREKREELSKQAIIELNHLRILTCKTIKEALFIDVVAIARDMFFGIKLAQDVITELVHIYITKKQATRRGYVSRLFKKLGIYERPRSDYDSELRAVTELSEEKKHDIVRQKVKRINAASITKDFDIKRVSIPTSANPKSVHGDDEISLSVREVLKLFKPVK